MGAFVLVAAPYPNRERYRFARAGREAVPYRDQIAGDESEEVRRLGMRIDPLRPMPAIAALAVLDRITVRQQHGEARFVGDNCRRVARHHIGTVDEIGYAAEAFGLALRAEIAARHVEAGELCVILGR